MTPSREVTFLLEKTFIRSASCIIKLFRSTSLLWIPSASISSSTVNRHPLALSISTDSSFTSMSIPGWSKWCFNSGDTESVAAKNSFLKLAFSSSTTGAVRVLVYSNKTGVTILVLGVLCSSPSLTAASFKCSQIRLEFCSVLQHSMT